MTKDRKDSIVAVGVVGVDATRDELLAQIRALKAQKAILEELVQAQTEALRG